LDRSFPFSLSRSLSFSFLSFSFLFSFSSLSTFSTATAQPKHTNLTLGSSLFATTNPTLVLSPSRLFAFGFYREGTGFKVGIWLETTPNKTIVWTANRNDPPVSTNS
ncbi:hypothetical protein PJI17_31490, partial [Mycobacterium kansasii]